jgi:hypothetical protein
MIKKLFLVFSIFMTASAWSGDEPPAPTSVTELQRLVAASGTEPLLAIGVENVQTLSTKFVATNFGKMLNDPDYKDGLSALIMSLNNGAGLNLGELLPRMVKLMSGPAVIALVPDGAAATGETGLKFVLYALTPSEDTARELNAVWPKDAPGGVFSAMSLQTVLVKDLPDAAKLPEWASKWPGGDVVIRALPKKLATATEKGLAAGKLDSLQPMLDAHGQFPLLSEIDAPDIDALNVGVKLDGDMFAEQLGLELAPNPTGSFAKVIGALREKSKSWDSLMTALPADQDLTILLQAEPHTLGDDLPLAVQSLERYLRGKRWSRKSGKSTEALDPKRYDFIFDRLNGEMGIVAKGSLTGQFNVTLATAMKAGEQDAVRADLVRGLESMGAAFETLKSARTIGSSSPLGAQFQGRGLFTNPLIGLSKGWAWLCSSLAAYQDLTSAFSSGNTLGAAEKKTPAKAEDVWRKSDALRLQINLERVIPPMYVAWTLSGEAVPSIGSFHIPPAMLVIKFQTFNGRLGMLRAGLSRTDRSVTSLSRSSFPGTSLILISLLQQMSLEIDESRTFAATPAAPVAVKAPDNKSEEKKQAQSEEKSAPKGQP